MLYSKRILVVLTLILLTFCIVTLSFLIEKRENGNLKRTETLGNSTSTVVGNIGIERLTTSLDRGLNRVKINDTLEVLIYTSLDGTSMIRIK